ncbi:MAG: hypothetical protein Q8O54_09200, partial [Brevundimonas sp.]|nr:hypothetical protein [Brevundimonas sp.]
MDEQVEAAGDDVFLTGSRVRVGPDTTGQGCLVSLGLAVAGGLGLMLLMLPLFHGIDLFTGDDERGVARGFFLALATLALGVWSAGWLFRWNTRRGLRDQLTARLPGFTGRTIPVGQLMNGPAAAGKLDGKYLLGVGQDRFVLMRHFHNTEHLDAFRALILGQFINAYQPNGLARVMDFAIPYRNVKSVTVEALTEEELRKGAFGRAVVHGLASWALDAALGARSTQDLKAAFVRIEMFDGQSLVFSVPSRVKPRLVAAMAAATGNASQASGHEISLGEATYDGFETLLDEGGIIDAPGDGWDDFLAALSPQGKRARAFAGLAAVRIQQEIDRALGRTAPAPLETPAQDRPPASDGKSGVRHDPRLILGLWIVGLLFLGTLFNALSATLRDGGNGDLELGLIVVFVGVAMVLGGNVWARRSGWLMAGIKSGFSVALAAAIAYAIGTDVLLTRGPLAPATQGVASATAGLFGREHRPGARPSAPVVASQADPAPAAAEDEAARARLDAERKAAEAAAEQARQQDMARAQTARLTAAEAIVRGVYDNSRSVSDPPAIRRRWMAP